MSLVPSDLFVDQVRKEVAQNPLAKVYCSGQRCGTRRRGLRAEHTPLVLPKLDGLLEDQLVGVHLGVKAVKQLENNGQVARARVDRTPRRDGFGCVHLWLDIFQVLLAKFPNGFALKRLAL